MKALRRELLFHKLNIALEMSSAFDLSVNDLKRKCRDTKPAAAAEACHTRNEELSMR
jgi:hypothetical protein